MAAMSRTENLGTATTSTVSGGIRRPPSGVTAATELGASPGGASRSGAPRAADARVVHRSQLSQGQALRWCSAQGRTVQLGAGYADDASVPHAESARGISPRAAHRSVRKPLDLYGSCHRANAAAIS